MENSMKLPLLSCYSIYFERLGCESTISNVKVHYLMSDDNYCTLELVLKA